MPRAVVLDWFGGDETLQFVVQKQRKCVSTQRAPVTSPSCAIRFCYEY